MKGIAMAVRPLPLVDSEGNTIRVAEGDKYYFNEVLLKPNQVVRTSGDGKTLKFRLSTEQ